MLPLTLWVKSPPLPPAGDERPSPILGLSETTLVGAFGTSLHPGEGGNHGFPLGLACVGRARQNFFVVFGCCRVVIVNKFSVLLGCFFLDPLELDLVRAFFFCCHWHFWIALLSSTQSRINEDKRKSRELISMLFLRS